MTTVPELWRKVPVVVRAVLVALLILIFGSIPPGIMAQVNLKVGTTVPWSAGAAAVYLWLFWRYLGGAGWPRRTSDSRRMWLRAASCPLSVWVWALAAGALGVAFTLAFMAVYQRVVPLAPMPFPDLSRAAAPTVAGVLLLIALTAGVVEEAAFRGYLQGPLEVRWGPTAAVGISAVLFALVHLANGAFALSRLPFYLSFGLFLGAIAYFARSILPVIVVHAFYDAQRLFRIWLEGFPRQAVPLAGTGVDAAFVLSCALVVAFGALTVWALIRLRSAARSVSPAPRRPTAPAV
jgi:membrane protease YdiL (CAAX protease family)